LDALKRSIAVKAGLFKVSEKGLKKAAVVGLELMRPEPITQIKRVFSSSVLASYMRHSPQAKGRFERGFRTMQDRLVKLMELDKITTIDAAN
jgi:hypothetical protein